MNIYDINAAKLPNDTKGILSRQKIIENFSLLLNKTANFLEEKKADIYKFEKGNPRRNEPDKVLKYNPNFSKIDFDALANRQLNLARNLFDNNIEVLELETENRLVLGLGTASVYEVGMTLHHVYGIPYIPATAVKGITRSWKILSDERFDEHEGIAISDKEFCDVFGCPDKVIFEENGEKKTYNSHYETNKEQYEKLSGSRKGQIVFFDAFPMNSPTIKEDIMNPHYAPYYTDAASPGDYHKPTPIPFLTIERTRFRFIIAGNNKDLLSKTKRLLFEALTDHGIGAKTAVGYGYFSPPNQNNQSKPQVEDPRTQRKTIPDFLVSGKLNPKKRYNMEAIIVISGKPNYIDVYIAQDKIQKEVKLDGTKNPIEVGKIVKVEVSVNNKGDITQASLKSLTM